MADHPTRAWNGGIREAAMAAADKRRDAAAAALRAAYQQTAARDPLRCTSPFADDAVPGWIYLPVEDCAILADTAQLLAPARDVAPALWAALLAPARDVAPALWAARRIIARDIKTLEECLSRGATGKREDIDVADLAALIPYDDAIRQIDQALREMSA